MRELTFAGFLSRYVRELSMSGTNSISKLAREAAKDNVRLREPLLLYALFSDGIAILQKVIDNNALLGQFSAILSRYNKEQMLQALEENDPALPAEYRKVWRSYLAQKNRKEMDAQTKELIRQRILSAQKEKGISNYRIYKTLGLNPGNINDWLKNGAGEKVSLTTARKAFAYVQSRYADPRDLSPA